MHGRRARSRTWLWTVHRSAEIPWLQVGEDSSWTAGYHASLLDRVVIDDKASTLKDIGQTTKPIAKKDGRSDKSMSMIMTAAIGERTGMQIDALGQRGRREQTVEIYAAELA